MRIPREGDLFFHPAPDVVRNRVSPPELRGKHETGSGLRYDVKPDGTITFKNPPAVSIERGGLGRVGSGVGLSIGGKFDANDMVMNAIGQDPYAAEKHRIAEATREERLCMAVADEQRRKREVLYRLNERLEAILQARELTFRQRREAVFELWDECLDARADSDVRLWASVRATVLAFIRRAFPPGTPNAYTDTEIVALNARRSSRERFDPYGRSGAPDAGRPPGN